MAEMDDMAPDAPMWESLEEASLWRKVAVGMWSRPREPAFFGTIEVEVDEMLDYLAEIRQNTGVRVTPTAFVVRVVAAFLERNPELNVIVVGNEVRRRTSVDIFCQVAIPGKGGKQADLSGVKLANCDQLELVDIAQTLHTRAAKTRSGTGDETGRARATLDLIPATLRPLAVRLIEFLTFEFPVNLEALGVQSDPFGGAMVSSIGQFGVEKAFAPLVPASRCPLVVLPGKIHEAPRVVDGEVVPRKVMSICCTADHRCYDGYQGGRFVQHVEEFIKHPRQHFSDPLCQCDRE